VAVATSRIEKLRMRNFRLVQCPKGWGKPFTVNDLSLSNGHGESARAYAFPAIFSSHQDEAQGLNCIQVRYNLDGPWFVGVIAVVAEDVGGVAPLLATNVVHSPRHSVRTCDKSSR